LPSALGPLLAAGGLLVYLTAVYAGAEAWGHVIPNGAAMQALGDVARDGFADVRKLGTPVPTRDGLVLITTVGIAMVALVVDLLAVTMRKAALAGLPLLSIFALCTSLAKDGAGWVPFSIGTAGYLWLLLADSRDRLARWGRPMGFDREARPRFNWSDNEVMPSPLTVMGRRIGLSAIAIAVVVPVLIPGLRGGVPHSGDGGGLGLGGGGSQSKTTINPIVSVTSQLAESTPHDVMRVQTSDPDPGYLRLTSLDQFDGRTFSPSKLEAPESARVSEGIAAPPVPGNRQTTHVDVGDDFDVAWLPLPQQVTAVEVDGDWRYDPVANTVFSARDDTEGLSYDVTSVTPAWTASDLEQAVTGTADENVVHLTDLPDIPPAVGTLTQQVIAGAQSPFEEALKIQDFLTSSPFVYDLSAPQTDSGDALAQFLIVTHRGFCQQFATSMAVMARIAGIPSRIAVGFTRGEHQQDGSWLVTTKDAHAWPELYLGGYGWVPFEPTPRGDGQAQAPSYTTETDGSPVDPANPDQGNNNGKGGKGQTQNGASKHDRLDNALDGFPIDLTGGGGGTTPTAGHPVRQTLLWIAAGLLALLLVVPSIARVLVRRRRWARAVSPVERADAAWEELRACAIDARAGWVDGLSPRATARALRMEVGGLATAELRALDRIVDSVQRAWYAPARSSMAAAADTLEDDVASIRIALFSEATVRERFVLHAWPRSTMRDAAALVGRIGAVLDAADLAGARVRARLWPRHAT
jgi:transglutaminase-like putative cysteine protease